MEFPELGTHCSEKFCKQLDFLPMKCDECNDIFCKDHIMYTNHSCPSSYKKDVQVPVCPLCNKPIPVKKGQSPDIPVGEHIDADCQSDPAKANRKKIFSNKCSLKGCKQKELVPVKCETCKKNFCLKHRLELDHKCEGSQSASSAAGAAAISRFDKNKSNKNQKKISGFTKSSQVNKNQGNAAVRIQNGMSDNEALARAVQMSLQENSKEVPQDSRNELSQEEEDRNLAKAIAESEQDFQRNHRRRNSERTTSTCSIS